MRISLRESERSPPGSLNSFPLEFHGSAGAIDFQRTVCSYGVGANEDPVLPGGKPAKHAGFERFGRTETQISFEAGERVGRLRGAGFDGLANFVLPIEVIGRRSDEAGFECLAGRQLCCDALAERTELRFVSIEARGQA